MEECTFSLSSSVAALSLLLCHSWSGVEAAGGHFNGARIVALRLIIAATSERSSLLSSVRPPTLSLSLSVFPSPSDSAHFPFFAEAPTRSTADHSAEKRSLHIVARSFSCSSLSALPNLVWVLPNYLLQRHFLSAVRRQSVVHSQNGPYPQDCSEVDSSMVGAHPFLPLSLPLRSLLDRIVHLQ